MNARREHIATIATLCAVVAVAAFLAGFLAAGWVRQADGPTATCAEDMACWDCTTMGNRICGPTTTEGGER